MGAGLGCLLVLPLVLFGVRNCCYLIFHRDVPISGSALASEDEQVIRKTCGLEEHENIVSFFALDFFTNMEDGSFFTQTRVVHYFDGTDPNTVQQAKYEDIEDISFDPHYVWCNQAKIVITRKDGTSFYLLLLKSCGAHQSFYRDLVQEWKSH